MYPSNQQSFTNVLSGGDLQLCEVSDQEQQIVFASAQPEKEQRPPAKSAGADHVSSTKISPIKKEETHICQVCSDAAAGFHCGAFVCEACKVGLENVPLSFLCVISLLFSL